MSSQNPEPLNNQAQKNECATGGAGSPPPTHPPDKGPGLAWIGFALLALFVIGIAGAAWFQQLRAKQVSPPPPAYGKVSAPTFIDETGTTFPISQLDGRIWVVDFIFTRCGSQCPIMTLNMKKLQDWLEENEQGNVKLVSITVDPEGDTPEALQRYARTFKADEDRWHFLTGDRKTIYDYILNDFKLETEENKGKDIADLFVHSDKFVLIDRERNIRGYYSGRDNEALEELRDAIISISQEGTPPKPQAQAAPAPE